MRATRRTLLLLSAIGCALSLRGALRPIGAIGAIGAIGVSGARLGVTRAPFDDIIPFLSEHINFSDQILFLGCDTDLALQLVRSEYGVRKTGSMLVVDADPLQVDALSLAAAADPVLAAQVAKGRLRFAAVDYARMPEVCRQSCFDAVVDFGGIDSVLASGLADADERAARCVQQLQNAVRLGNILVSLSRLDDAQFRVPFERGFGWVQELDGDPGQLSAWYRGRSNVQASASNFNALGLRMFVYTNADNC